MLESHSACQALGLCAWLAWVRHLNGAWVVLMNERFADVVFKKPVKFLAQGTGKHLRDIIVAYIAMIKGMEQWDKNYVSVDGMPCLYSDVLMGLWNRGCKDSELTAESVAADTATIDARILAAAQEAHPSCPALVAGDKAKGSSETLQWSVAWRKFWTAQGL